MESPGHSFPIEQDVCYTSRQRNSAAPPAMGKTIYISSHEVGFTTKAPLNLGEKMEVTVNWPALIDQRCPMKLVIFGRVVKNDATSAAVAIERHEFRTRAARRATSA